MNLKTSRETLRAHHLNYLDPEKETEGGERKIVEVINENIKILYGKTVFPFPFVPRTTVTIEVVKDYKLRGGKKATLVCAAATTHPSVPEDPTKDVRLKSLMYADFYEELQIGENPITRWTSLVAGSPELPRILNFLANKENNNYVESCIEMFADKYDRDDSNEQFIQSLMEEENISKLDVGNSLEKVFMGSKFYLVFMSISVVLTIFNNAILAEMELDYKNKWENTTVCMMNVTENP